MSFATRVHLGSHHAIKVRFTAHKHFPETCSCPPLPAVLSPALPGTGDFRRVSWACAGGTPPERRLRSGSVAVLFKENERLPPSLGHKLHLILSVSSSGWASALRQGQPPREPAPFFPPALSPLPPPPSLIQICLLQNLPAF